MPEFVQKALQENDLLERYQTRPPYQQNDYLWWINNAKRPETKQKRLKQMLMELRDGNRYMKMQYRPRAARQR